MKKSVCEIKYQYMDKKVSLWYKTMNLWIGKLVTGSEQRIPDTKSVVSGQKH